MHFNPLAGWCAAVFLGCKHQADVIQRRHWEFNDTIREIRWRNLGLVADSEKNPALNMNDGKIYKNTNNQETQ